MYPSKCLDCGLLGSCYGACNKTLAQYPNQDFCILQEINMATFLTETYKIYYFFHTLLALICFLIPNVIIVHFYHYAMEVV